MTAELPPAPPLTACAVCGHVVDTHVEDGVVVGHTHTVATVDDHPVVPVAAGAILTDFRCDFCLASNSRWALPVEPFMIGPGYANADDWAACDDCALALRQHDWNKLVYRAKRAHEARNPGLPFDREVYVQLYRQLRRHITGPVRLRTRS